MESSHDAIKHTGQLRQALESQGRPIGFLIGAGCPLAIRDKGGKALIPDVEGMTKVVSEQITASDCKEPFAKVLGHLASKGGKPAERAANLEDYLSHIRTLVGVSSRVSVDSLTPEILRKLETKICTAVAELAKAPLPADTPYHKLAAWIRGVNRTSPVELFTTNYDLLLETALESFHVPYFDGFLGAKAAFFDPYAIEVEETSLPPRWARLWKLHGSINWWADSSEEPTSVVRGETGNGEVRLIHPSHLKYDESRQMPYLAMMDRLKAFFRKPGSLLITAGFSFSDRHINALIRQSLAGNADAAVFGLLFDKLEKYPAAAALAVKTPNLTLMAQDRAVIGTRAGTWALGSADGAETGVKKAPTEGGAPSVELGDFAVLGNILGELIGVLSGAPSIHANGQRTEAV